MGSIDEFLFGTPRKSRNDAIRERRADIVRRTYGDYSDPNTGELPDQKSFNEKVVQELYRYGDIEGIRDWTTLQREQAGRPEDDPAEIRTFKRLYPGVDPGSEEGRRKFFKMKEDGRAKPSSATGELKGYHLSKIKSDVTGELIQQYRKRNPRDKDLVAMNQMLGLEYGQKPSLEQLQDAFAQMGYDDLAQYGDELYSGTEQNFDAKNPTGAFQKVRDKLRGQYFKPTAAPQKKGGMMESFPDPSKHKRSKPLVEYDAQGKPTGRKFKSDGKKWIQISQSGGINLAMNAEDVPVGTGLVSQAKSLFQLRKELNDAYMQGDDQRAAEIERMIQEIARQTQNVG